MNTKKVKRGEIYYADLNPVTGSEQGEVRPVLIVQNDVGNAHSPTTIIVPLTARNKGRLPTHVKISRTGRLRSDSIALVEQPRGLMDISVGSAPVNRSQLMGRLRLALG